MENIVVNVIGAGLAGCECAYQLAKRGIKVKLYEQKPKKFSPAHSNPDFAEIVCSNSLKSNELTNACGLMKQEMRELDSLIINCADRCKVPSGNALSVDREKFSQMVTEIIKNNENIEVIYENVENIDKNQITVVATGPLTDEKLAQNLANIIGENSLYFFDAASPIVSLKSLDKSRYFFGNRYQNDKKFDKNVNLKSGQEQISQNNQDDFDLVNRSNQGTNIKNICESNNNKTDCEIGDYVNCTMTKEEYDCFYNELINAKIIELKEFENGKVFEGCMPVEVLAKRGYKSLLFANLKPVGLFDEEHNMKPYAVLQLRKESLFNDLYNLVGFQTNLTFGEQKRVFSLIPALKNAEFIKYGVMHKNTYLNAPKVLNKFMQLKTNENIYIAGQLSGVEGYVESSVSGLMVAIYIYQRLNNEKQTNVQNQNKDDIQTEKQNNNHIGIIDNYQKENNIENVKISESDNKFTEDDANQYENAIANQNKIITLSSKTSTGALLNYIINCSPQNFQPMNANWGIMERPMEKDYKNKAVEIALKEVKEFVEQVK